MTVRKGLESARQLVCGNCGEYYYVMFGGLGPRCLRTYVEGVDFAVYDAMLNLPLAVKA